jgi:hypothetical protein
MWRGLQRGINFYWRIVVIMDPYYTYGLASNARTGSFPPSMYGPGVAAAANELNAMENRRAGIVPRAPRKLYNGRRPRISSEYARLINERRGNFPYERISNNPYAWANGPPMLRGTVAGTPERGFNPNGAYNGPAVPFSGFGGRGRSRRRRRATKKQTRKQQRRV